MAMKTKPAKKPNAARKPKSAPAGAGPALSVATNKQKGVQERVAALAQAPLAVGDSGENMQAVLGVLGDVSEPIEIRMAALQSLQAASFSVVAFESISGDYRATLRKVAQD